MQTDRRTDGQTDMAKIVVAFHNFANAPINKSNISFPAYSFTAATKLNKIPGAGLNVKYKLFFSDFNETLILSTEFRTVLKYQIL